MSSQLEGIEWHAHEGAGDRQRPLLRDPARVVTVVGGLMMFVGCLMPWAAGIDGRRLPVAFGANDGSADGVFLVVAALVILILTLSRAAAESPSRSVQLIPFVAVAVAAIVWITGERSSRFAIAGWTAGGGHGAQTWALWISAGGIVVAVVGSVWIHLTRPEAIRRRTTSLAKEWDLTRQGVVEAVGAMFGAVIGGGTGLAVGIVVAGYIGILLMVVLTAFGIMFGMQAGMFVVRWVSQRMASY